MRIALLLAVLAACSVKPVTFTPESELPGSPDDAQRPDDARLPDEPADPTPIDPAPIDARPSMQRRSRRGSTSSSN